MFIWRDLETIVLKAIVPDPDRRYATALEMADDLRRFLSDIPVQARRTTTQEKSWRRFRRDRLLAVVVATVALLLVVVSVVASIGYVRAVRDLQDQTALREQAESALRLTEERLREALARESELAPATSP